MIFKPFYFESKNVVICEAVPSFHILYNIYLPNCWNFIYNII